MAQVNEKIQDVQEKGNEDAFKLYHWIHGNASFATTANLAGSATSGLSLEEIISLSSDPARTKEVFTSTFLSAPQNLASSQGSLALRQAIADTYTADFPGSPAPDPGNIVIANATTGCNHLVLTALLKPSDHVIIQYPTYGPLFEEPGMIGCSVDYWRLRPRRGWEHCTKGLEMIYRPGQTKMIIINNPNNPTGSYIHNETLKEVVLFAKKYNLIVLCDEIFRPLYYDVDLPSISCTNFPNTTNQTNPYSIPYSLTQLSHTTDYTNLITTSSLSKSYGLSGIRIGWIHTPSPALLKLFLQHRLFTSGATSVPDELIAAECLSSRCRPAILSKHISLAKTNIKIIEEELMKRYPEQIEWTRPRASGIGFVLFKDKKTGEPVDELDFCWRLVRAKGVLLSPGGECFDAPGINGKISNVVDDAAKVDQTRFRKMHATDGEEMKNGAHKENGSNVSGGVKIDAALPVREKKASDHGMVGRFRGRARIHITAPTERVRAAVEKIAEFLEEQD